MFVPIARVARERICLGRQYQGGDLTFVTWLAEDVLQEISSLPALRPLFDALAERRPDSGVRIRVLTFADPFGPLRAVRTGCR